MLSTFQVDDVAPVITPLAARSFRDRFPEMIEGSEPDAQLVDVGEAHPLIGAVHRAFSEHRPLVLTPDAVWLTIAQGFAQHVRLHAEKLRDRFVRHSGKKTLEVAHYGAEFPKPIAPIIDQFRELIADEVGAGIARLLVCDFSTTTDIERTASAIVLMDAFQSYFDYDLRCICGIPWISVTGTEQDWRSIGERVRVLAEFDLDWWTPSLERIAAKLQEAAAGRADQRFFQRIYKPQKAYGGNVVAGWIARLYPYLKNEGAYDRRNSLLQVAEEDVERHATPSDSPMGYRGPGIRTDSTMSGLSRVPLKVKMARQPERRVELVGGLVGVAQRTDGALAAHAGWFVQPSRARIDEVIEKLREAGVPSGQPAKTSFLDGQGPAELIVLDKHFDGGVLPCGWSLRSRKRRDAFVHSDSNRFLPDAGVGFTVFADLPDGSCLAFATNGGVSGVMQFPPGGLTQRDVVLSGKHTAMTALACPKRDVAWIGDSIAQVLMRALEPEPSDPSGRGAADATLEDFAPTPEWTELKGAPLPLDVLRNQGSGN